MYQFFQFRPACSAQIVPFHFNARKDSAGIRQNAGSDPQEKS
jgi:hypothetical protein